ncbi:MAG TPA: hypothetical protein VHN14_12600 [Kofleriaceae bacterium]|nr:hypothetical protein [Kofleriaceae bacterium]
MSPSISSPSKRLVCLLAILVLAPATAFAGKKDEAKAHIAKATKAHKDGHFEDALVELEAAYALDPQPDLLFAVGQVEAKLGNCSVAITYFKRFVATQKDPQIAKVIDQAIASCKPAAAPVASPPPAPDEPAPAPPAPAPPAPAPPPPAKERPHAPPEVTRAPRPRARAMPVPAPVATRQRSPWYKDKLGDGLVLGGAVATVVGLVEYGSARSDLDTAEDRTRTTNLARYHELVDSAHGKRLASVVLVGAGGALIAGGILHYVLHGRTTETRGVGIAPAHGGGVVTYEGSF